MAVDMEKVSVFVEQFVGDLGAAVHSGMVVIGEQLGLYKALAEGPMNSADLALKTRTDERYVREWLGAQAAGGCLAYSEKTREFSLNEAQPVTAGRVEPRGSVPDALLFRPSYAARLLSSWIPALQGVEATLQAGGRIADVCCGRGASTLMMAKAFPKSQFFGFDHRERSIAGARLIAAREGLEVRVNFGVASAKEFPGRDYDLVTMFDCLHQIGDPLGAATQVRHSLSRNGTWMIVEPFTSDQRMEHVNPQCRGEGPSSASKNRAGLRTKGAAKNLCVHSGEKRIQELVAEAGFTRFRRAVETPFSVVFEVRP